MTKLSLFTAALLLLSVSLNAQVGIGTNSPDSSAMLDIVSSNKGLLPPRLNSDTQVANPTVGLIIYDLSDNCLNSFDGSQWKNLCEHTSSSQSGNGSGAGIGSNGLFSWQNTIPMAKIWGAPYEAALSTGIDQDGNAYVWGYDQFGLTSDFSRSDDASTTATTSTTGTNPQEFFSAPLQLSDTALDNKTTKIVAVHRRIIALNSDNELWGFGSNNGGVIRGSSSNTRVYHKLRKLPLPPSITSTDYVLDFWHTLNRIIILTNEGRVFWYSHDITTSAFTFSLGPTNHSTSWNEVAQPTGAAPDFQYTRILNVNLSEESSGNYRRALFLMGTDINGTGVYGCGREINPGQFVFGNPSLPPDGIAATTSSGVHPITFPAGVADSISHIQVHGNGAIAVTTDEKWYYWGDLGDSETSNLALRGLWQEANVDEPTTNNWHYLNPTEMPLPPGETGVKDAFLHLGLTKGLTVVGSSGKIYFYGITSRHNSRDNWLLVKYPEGTGANYDFVEAYSTNHVNAKRIIVGEYSIMIHDEDGQVWGLGELKKDEGMVVQPAWGISGNGGRTIQVNHSIAVPLWDVTTDDQ